MEQLQHLDFSEEMRNSFRDYALSVIIARAVPDVRDGLKPVQRRILYAMNELGLDPKKPHRKSARIVGDTMGKYHPHGDSSIYEALVHMSEEWSLTVPLVDGHGNFGSIDGDGAAAMRYTEARLSEGGTTLLEHLDKNLVDFVPNFDESEKEPVVLPAMIPNLLINGTTGIAVGMATNIPTHNPGEVIDGCIAYLDNPAITTEELMQIIPGPDFPTGGIIVNGDSLPGIYENGEGKIRIRAKTVIEKGESGRTNIVITEIPYTSAGTKTKLVESLVGLMRDKVFDEIYDVRDESSKEGIRIVVEVKRDRDVQNLLNGLFKKSAIEDTYSVNLLAIKEQQPIVFSLKSMIREFIEFQEILYTRENQHLLEKAQQRLEIVEGLLRATDVIDLIIEILRGSTSVKQAKDCLMFGDVTDIKFKSEESRMQAFRLDFTQSQAEAILAMPLYRLIGLEILKLQEEQAELNKNIAKYKNILSKKSALHAAIRGRLQEYRKRFDTPRRTQIMNIETTGYVQEVKIEDIYVLIDKFGYTKTIDEVTYSKAQPETLKEFTHIVRMKNNDVLCVFTAEGNVLRVKAEKLPRCRIKEKGVLIHNLCKIDQQEAVFYCAFENLFDSQLLFVTAGGYIKLTSGIEFDTARQIMAATKLEDKDRVVAISLLSAGDILAGNRRVILTTHNGYGLAFPLSEVPELKKTGRGVKAVSMDKADRVTFAAAVAPEAEDLILPNGKTLPVKKLRMKPRASKGTKL